MARCGCGSPCTCLVTGCDDGSVTVTGTGSSTNPYVVCAAPTPVVGCDDGSATVTGSGTQADPYVVCAHPSVVAGPGVVVTGTGTPSDPYVVSDDPAGNDTSVIGCDGPDVDVTVTGTGNAADPYVVCARIDYSEEAGNIARPGTDGGLYVPPTPIFGCDLIAPNACNALCCDPVTGQLFVPKMVPSAVSVGMTQNQAFPGAGPSGQASVILNWDTINFLTPGSGADYGPAAGPDGTGFCIEILTPGLYSIDLNRRDGVGPENVGNTINLAILINGVRRAGGQQTRSNDQSHRLEANGTYLLNAGDVVCGQWSVLGAGGQPVDPYTLLGDVRNNLTISKLAPIDPACDATTATPC